MMLLSSGFKCTGTGNETEQKKLYSSSFHQGSALTAHVVVCLMIFDWLVSLPSSQSSLVVAVIVVEFAWWPKLKLPVFGLNCPSSWETSGDLATREGAFPEPNIVEPADLPLPEPYGNFMPRRRRSSLLIMPDSRLSKKGLRYGMHAVIMLKFNTAWVHMAVGQKLRVGSCEPDSRFR